MLRSLALRGFGRSKILWHKTMEHHLHRILCEWLPLEYIIEHRVNVAPGVVRHGGHGSQSVRTRNFCSEPLAFAKKPTWIEFSLTSLLPLTPLLTFLCLNCTLQYYTRALLYDAEKIVQTFPKN